MTLARKKSFRETAGWTESLGGLDTDLQRGVPANSDLRPLRPGHAGRAMWGEDVAGAASDAQSISTSFESSKVCADHGFVLIGSESGA